MKLVLSREAGKKIPRHAPASTIVAKPRLRRAKRGRGDSYVAEVNTDYLIFLCTASEDKVVLSKEHIDYQWVDLVSFRKKLGDYFAADLIESQEVIKKLLDN